MAENGFTAEMFETWISARGTYRRAHEAFGLQAGRTIFDRLINKLLIARAENMFIGADNADYGIINEVPVAFWSAASAIDQPSRFPLWNTNSMSCSVPRAGTYNAQYRLFNVRFDPVGVQKMLPQQHSLGVFGRIAAKKNRESLPQQEEAPTPSQSLPPTPQPVARIISPGGRPPKPFWEDLWIEMCRQIYSGDLKHETQADIERAMLDWAAKQGHELSEQTARLRARRLIAVLRAEDKN